ncbi:hypothetical protein PVAND_014575 [Polypedilum vanderplanki]|uniref:Uncharacterized protein n=1 Tax=Polypedilum vanderplanki TaxID=319348 RepID=A0A9J6BA41_POLVA|nr:hypothetical protein PVAND_014575 [Polypedilum vanderplanki]
MKIIKISLFISTCLITFLLSVKVSNEEFKIGTRFRNVKCFVNEIYGVLNFCFIKAYSRNYVSLNYNIIFKKPLKKPIFTSIYFNRRYGTILRRLMAFEKLDWCSIMTGVQTHKIIDVTKSILKGTTVKFFYECPLTSFEFLNVTSDDSDLLDTQLLLSGIYRLDILFATANDNIGFLNLTYEIKSRADALFGKDNRFKTWP